MKINNNSINIMLDVMKISHKFVELIVYVGFAQYHLAFKWMEFSGHQLKEMVTFNLLNDRCKYFYFK